MRKLFSRIALAALSLILSLVLVEILLRLTMPHLKPHTQADETYGFWNIPNADYHYVALENCPTWERRGRVNAKGLMDVEHDYDPPAGTFRILALGDSYTEALQFEAESGWVKQLESALNRTSNGDLSYEVINAGRSGMGAGLEYLYYVNEAFQYQADVVLVLFTPNDYEDDNKVLVANDRPYIIFEGDTVKIDNSFRTEQRYQIRKQTDWLRQNLLTVALLRQLYTRFDSAQQPIMQPDENPSLSTVPLSPVERHAIETTHRILAALRAEVEADGAAFVLIHGTSAYQVYGERDPNLPPTLRDTDWLLAEFATTAAFNYLNLVPIFQAAAQNGQNFLHGCEAQGTIGHWSREGHALAANAILDYLIGEAFIPAA